MLPLSRAEFMNIHPYAPEEQVEGYTELIENLSSYLCTITGFKGCTLQPNSGAAGEYTGLRVIRAYQESIGQGHRDIVLLPASAHGTNPASAIQCGYKTVTVKCDENGNIDLEDFRAKAEENKERLAASMITYAWYLRGGHQGDVRHRSRLRRTALYGWRQHERAGWIDKSGYDRRRCMSLEPA